MNEQHGQIRIALPIDQIGAFCRRHGVRELSLFGSVLREDFRPDSDVDVMLEFHPGHGFTFENTPAIIAALRTIFGREIDVVEKGRIRNRFRNDAIMGSRRVVYAA